jgi:hypothetical protein
MTELIEDLDSLALLYFTGWRLRSPFYGYIKNFDEANGSLGSFLTTYLIPVLGNTFFDISETILRECSLSNKSEFEITFIVWFATNTSIYDSSCGIGEISG